jgi:uncharacterized protein
MTRRSMTVTVIGLLFCVVSFGLPGPAQADPDYSDQKVVYHNDGGAPDNPKYFRKLLRNARNHVNALGKEHIELRVVDHGDGIVMLQVATSDKELADQIDGLRADGVVFLVCRNTLSERKIDWVS